MLREDKVPVPTAYWLSNGRKPNTSIPDDPCKWVSDTSGNESDDTYYLNVLLYAGIANTFLTLFRAFIFAWGGLKAARQLYSQLLLSVLNAGVAFFDQNPVTH